MDRTKKKKRWIQVLVLLAVTGMVGGWSFFIWSKIPASIKIRAGQEEELDFHVPVSGTMYEEEEEFVPALGGGIKNLYSENREISVNLAEPLTLYSDNLTTYRMDLKLFGMIPFKTVNVEVIEDEKLIPVGRPIGIYVKTDGILVIATGEFTGEDHSTKQPVKHLLQAGDYILKVDGKEVEGKKEFIRQIEENGGREMVLTIRRNDEIFDLKVKPEADESGEYKLGIWIRDNAQGVGTMTYLRNDGSFGALGHGINDMDTSELLDVRTGSLYKTEIVSITKGQNGTPGELTGVIDYDMKNKIGVIDENTVEGIFGTVSEEAARSVSAQALPIGLKQDIHTGKAQILCSIGEQEEPQLYDVEITAIHPEHDNVNRGLEIQVTDERLMEKTGGIVQGMSGSPVIQDGKIIGAVTHVLVKDPTRGFGIFIENML